jgi:hypothetical protein
VEDRFREGESGGDTGGRFGDCGAEEEDDDIVDEYGAVIAPIALSASACCSACNGRDVGGWSLAVQRRYISARQDRRGARLIREGQ